MPKNWKRGNKSSRRYYPVPAQMPMTRSRRFYTEGDVDEIPEFRDLHIHSSFRPPSLHRAFDPFSTHLSSPRQQFIEWDYRTPHPREDQYDLVLVRSRRTNTAARAAGPSNQAVMQPSHAHFSQVPWTERIIPEHLVQDSASPAVESSGPPSVQVNPAWVNGGSNIAPPFGVPLFDSEGRVFYAAAADDNRGPPKPVLFAGGHDQVMLSNQSSVFNPVVSLATTASSSPRPPTPSVVAPRAMDATVVSALSLHSVARANHRPVFASDDEVLPHDDPDDNMTSRRRSPRLVDNRLARIQEKSPSLKVSNYWNSGVGGSHFFEASHSFCASEAAEELHGVEANLFEDIRSVPLIVEVPISKRKFPDSMMDPSKSHERWKRCSHIYVIMPSKFQVGNAATLAIPHGHFPLVELIPQLVSFSRDPLAVGVRVEFIGSCSNFSDANIIIRNDVGQSALPWDEIRMGLTEIQRPLSTDVSRQRVFVDLGYAGGQCVGRNSVCDLGLAAPRLLVSSRDSTISKAFFSKTRCVDVLLRGAESMNGSEIPADRVKRWGNTLGERNSKEAARLHETTWSPHESAICALHTDGQNGRFSQVSFCNRVFLGEDGRWYRQGAVMYMRKSIDDYEVRRQKHAPYLTHVKKILEEDLHNRLEQDTAVLRSRDLFEIAEGINVARIACNAEVESYYQPFVACANRLAHAFKLDELQLTSVLLSMAQSACSAAYVLAATEVAIARKEMVTSDLGWTLLDIIRFIDNQKTKPIKVPLRFSKYAMFGEESEKRWMKHVRVSMRAMRAVRAKTTSLTQADYNSVKRAVSGELAGVGHLRSNHLIGIAAILGLVPMSLFGMIDGGAQKAYDRLADTFPDYVTDKVECLENIRHLVEFLLGRRVTHRYVENLFCKVGRRMAGSDKRYHDIVDVRFPLLVVRGNRLSVRDGRGTERVVPSVFDVTNGMVRSNIPSKFKSKFRSWMSTKKGRN